ncbi:hypothetical protein FACS1894182_02940 [Bacteroidia bacterium]|nr:hypothetical protein FACS1894182_02940 [Bacteroidia bacterium]
MQKEEFVDVERLAYQAPRVKVDRIMLEGPIADSYNPSAAPGAAEYTDYEEDPETLGDILIF